MWYILALCTAASIWEFDFLYMAETLVNCYGDLERLRAKRRAGVPQPSRTARPCAVLAAALG